MSITFASKRKLMPTKLQRKAFHALNLLNYSNYEIDRVFASRCINSNGQKRGKLSEILVHNYKETK